MIWRMVGRLSGTDRGRNLEVAALACCAVFGVLAIWLFVRLVWALVPRGDDAFDTAPAHVAGMTGAAPAQSIAKWHLFGNTTYASGAAGSNSSAAMLSLILRGTVSQSDPRQGIAVISDPANGERAFRVGEDVVAGARLDGVYPDHVVIAHGGTTEVLKLPRDLNLAPGDIVRPTPATASSRDAISNATGPAAPSARPASMPASGVAGNAGTAKDWQQTVARLRQNPAELMRRVQVVPVLNDGKLAGVRLAGPDAALISQIGLQPGDVVTSVNGMPVDSFARGQQIISSLENSSSVRVTVLRNGTPTEVTVGLK